LRFLGFSVKASAFAQDFREVFVVFVVEHEVRVRDAKVILARLSFCFQKEEEESLKVNIYS